MKRLLSKIIHWVARWIWIAMRSETDEFLESITGQYEAQNRRLEERERAFDRRAEAVEKKINKHYAEVWQLTRPLAYRM